MQPSYDAPRRKSNTGLIVGLILGGIGLCCVLPFSLIVGGGFFAIKEAGGFVTCGIAFQDIYSSLGEYAKANGGKLPKAATWQTDILPYYQKAIKNHKDTGPFTVMSADGAWGCKNDNGTTGIAFNPDLSEKPLDSIKDKAKTPILFEIESAKLNAAEPFKERDPKTGPELMMGQRRSWIVMMADGQVKVSDPNGKPLDIKFQTK